MAESPLEIPNNWKNGIEPANDALVRFVRTWAISEDDSLSRDVLAIIARLRNTEMERDEAIANLTYSESQVALLLRAARAKEVGVRAADCR